MCLLIIYLWDGWVGERLVDGGLEGEAKKGMSIQATTQALSPSITKPQTRSLRSYMGLASTCFSSSHVLDEAANEHGHTLNKVLLPVHINM